ncbi:hypothetical protein L207DRAFT_160895 [Hyaloscypha variabilis F]|uniref:Uncharacterized protein n=1 Tax=Hyaloscypha variabilis (strain UAMH 11265 / GT02V1 / F) TaxID=1149755 RepID=A0A2J6S9Z6_HYAVF|nr:hypothetical protein L207DRAFT_160895 [Hyaloscypha variabilis F]
MRSNVLGSAGDRDVVGLRAPLGRLNLDASDGIFWKSAGKEPHLRIFFDWWSDPMGRWRGFGRWRDPCPMTRPSLPPSVCSAGPEAAGFAGGKVQKAMRDGHRPASGTICPIGPWTVQCSPSMVWRQVHGRRLVKSRERGAFQERRDDIPDSLSDALSRIEGSRASGHQGIRASTEIPRSSAGGRTVYVLIWLIYARNEQRIKVRAAALGWLGCCWPATEGSA